MHPFLSSDLKKAGLTSALLFCAWAIPLGAADLAPSYTAAGIVDSATQTAGYLAPNSIATLYGSNLAFGTFSSDSRSGALQTNLGGVTVYVGAYMAPLLYVSPTQINFLVPYDLTAGSVRVAVARQGLAGPSIQVTLTATAPGMFRWGANYAVGCHLNGSLITPEAPAKPGETIILFVDGLGRTRPDTQAGRLVSFPATIVAQAELQVTLGGAAVASTDVLYAGLAPGFAGLYQINLKLPVSLPSNPEIQVKVGSQASPPGLVLPAQGVAVAKE